MKSLARLSCLVALLCLGFPVTGLSDDHGHGGYYHGGSYHGGYYHGSHYYGGPHVHFYGGYYPYGGVYPYYPAPYYYGSYYDGPSAGFSISPSATYRGAQVDDGPDNLAMDVQSALHHEGYYHGGIDGQIGSGSRAAIRQYQYDHHLEVTGRIDRSLLRSLGLD